MNDTIRLSSTDELRNKATTIMTTADEFNNSLNKCSGAVGGILENWKDDNAKIYEGKFEELASTFQNFYENLQAMGTCLNKEADQLDELTQQERTQVEGQSIDSIDQI